MVLDTDDSIDEVFATHVEDIVQIVEEIEVNHLQAPLASLQGMTVSARDRFIATERMRLSCENRLGKTDH